jgi:hypothetical protein
MQPKERVVHRKKESAALRKKHKEKIEPIRRSAEEAEDERMASKEKRAHGIKVIRSLEVE